MHYIEGLKREKLGKNHSNKSRKLGYIPAVVYDVSQNEHVNLNKEQTLEVLKQHGENALIELKVGPKVSTVLIKDLQRHPVSQELLHIDLKPVDSDKFVQTKVPVNFTNTEKIKKQRGVIQTQKKDLDIECKAKDVPRVVNVDISKLDLGGVLKVKDIEISEELVIINNPEDVVAVITNADQKNMTDIESNI